MPIKFDVPKQVKIGGKVYIVYYPYAFPDGGDHLGQIQPDYGLMKLCSQGSAGHPLPLATVAETFIHEILHGIDSMLGKSVLGGDEAKTDMLANAILAVLVDNGWLVVDDDAGDKA